MLAPPAPNPGGFISVKIHKQMICNVSQLKPQQNTSFCINETDSTGLLVTPARQVMGKIKQIWKVQIHLQNRHTHTHTFIPGSV